MSTLSTESIRPYMLGFDLDLFLFQYGAEYKVIPCISLGDLLFCLNNVPTHKWSSPVLHIISPAKRITKLQLINKE